MLIRSAETVKAETLQRGRFLTSTQVISDVTKMEVCTGANAYLTYEPHSCLNTQ